MAPITLRRFFIWSAAMAVTKLATVSPWAHAVDHGGYPDHPTQCDMDHGEPTRTAEPEVVERLANALAAGPHPPVIDAHFDSDLLQASTTQEFNEVLHTTVERTRLGHHLAWADARPTGFHLPPNGSAQIRVTQLQAGAGTPSMLIGTYSRHLAGYTPVVAPLTVNGVTTITADSNGGILYVFYTRPSGNPTGRIRVEFLSGHRPMPYFVLGQTSDTQWRTMLDTMTAAPDVQLLSNRAMMVVSRANALLYRNESPTALMALLDRIILIEQGVSGLDGSAAQHVQARHLQLLTQSEDSNYYMAASQRRTFYVGAQAISRILSLQGLGVNGWGPWHELGHTHQQAGWRWPAVNEVTVNLYSLAVERGLGHRPSRLVVDGRWNEVRSYLALPNASRNFNDSTTSLWVRLGMFQQLRLAFGPRFFPNLHKRTRLDLPAVDASDVEKMRYFMVRSSQVSGRNLGPFFRKWGLPVPQSVFDEITALGLPLPARDPATVTDEDILSHDGFEHY